MVTKDKPASKDVSWHHEGNKLFFYTYDEVSDICFDIVIATWWETALKLHLLKSNTYGYFVQSIESKFYSDSDVFLKRLADSTYLLPINFITEASWIKNFLKKKYDIEAHLAPNGIRKDIFTIEGISLEPKNPKKLRILIEGSLDLWFKNVRKTIALCNLSNADELWLLTSTPVKEVKGVARTFSNVPVDKVAEIYRSCDIIVKLSYIEGMFGPPLEMFHCGGTAIVYDVTGHEEYIRNNENSYVIHKDDEKEVIRKINYLNENRAELERLKLNAISTAQKWVSWKESSEGFLNIINNSFTKQIVTPEYLKEFSKFQSELFNLAYRRTFKFYKDIVTNKTKDHIKAKAPFMYKTLKSILKNIAP
jgi:glycosyltransferase involved in cell wall biosynthesis